MNKEIKYLVLELFAGAGGLEQAGFKTEGLIEVDKYAVATLENII